jgi:uncharacterized membrane protein YozB (DUF420 family)
MQLKYIGVATILTGAFLIIYCGIHYGSNETVLGNATSLSRYKMYFTPMVAVVFLIAGVALLSRKSKIEPSSMQ